MKMKGSTSAPTHMRTGIQKLAFEVLLFTPAITTTLVMWGVWAWYNPTPDKEL